MLGVKLFHASKMGPIVMLDLWAGRVNNKWDKAVMLSAE